MFALHRACYRNNFEKAAQLISQGYDLEKKDCHKKTVFLNSCSHGHLQMVKFLQLKGCDLHARTEKGNGLAEAAAGGKLDVVKYLFEQGLDPNDMNESGKNSLMVASQKQHVETVQYLSEIAGCDVNAVSENGANALMCAVLTENNLEVVKYLFSRGVDANALSHDGKNALMFAVCTKNSLEVVKYLISRGVDLNATSHRGENVLHVVCSGYCSFFNADLAVVKYLVSKGLDVNALCNNGQNALIHAVLEKKSDLPLVKYLVSQGVDIHQKNVSRQRNAFMFACQTGSHEVMKFLYQQGADPHELDGRGETALMIAATYGQFEIVKNLQGEGCSIHLENVIGENAFMLACCYPGIDLLKYLREEGADIHKQNDNGQNAFSYVAGGVRYRSIDSLEYLQEMGLDMHLRSTTGETCLMTASKVSNIEAGKFFLQEGFSLADTNSQGENALTICIKGAHYFLHDMCVWLLENGCSLQQNLLSDELNDAEISSRISMSIVHRITEIEAMRKAVKTSCYMRMELDVIELICRFTNGLKNLKQHESLFQN